MIKPRQQERRMAVRGTVPVEEALSQLDELLDIIDGPNTRVAPRRVERVEVLRRSELPATRAGDDLPSDLDSMLYFVDFADSQGSAILGADNRLPAVLSVTETSVDWKQRLLDYDVTQIGTGPVDTVGRTIISLVKNYIDLKISSRGFRSWYREWEDYVAPMMRTKWHQQSPYNDLCFTNDGSKAYAGCGAIALGQIFYFNHFPQIINNYRFDWDLIGQWTVDSKSYNDLGMMEIAYFIHYIGLNIDTIYGETGSGTKATDAALFMDRIGYQNVELCSYTDADIKHMIFHRYEPCFVSGFYTNGLFVAGGHAWVIDGAIRRYYTFCQSSTINGRVVEMETNEEELLVHCNFGWGKTYDGFYHSGIFDLSKPAELINDELGEWPISNANGYIFDYNLQMIKY